SLDWPIGSCSWESRRSPKPLHGVQILAILLLTKVPEPRGIGLCRYIVVAHAVSRDLGPFDAALFTRSMSVVRGDGTRRVPAALLVLGVYRISHASPRS